MKKKLYKISHPEVKDVLFIYTNNPRRWILSDLDGVDHGSMDYDDWDLLNSNESVITQITDIDDVDEYWKYEVPFSNSWIESDYYIKMLFENDFVDTEVLKLEKTLYIMSGISGSGKSTLSSQLAHSHLQNFPDSQAVVLSTDEVFSTYSGDKKLYLWTVKVLAIAHEINRAKCEVALERGVDCVVVDNTNTTWKEIEPYAELAKQFGYKVKLVEPTTDWKYDSQKCSENNSHGVPQNIIQKQLERLLKYQDEIKQKIKTYE